MHRGECFTVGQGMRVAWARLKNPPTQVDRAGNILSKSRDI